MNFTHLNEKGIPICWHNIYNKINGLSIIGAKSLVIAQHWVQSPSVIFADQLCHTFQTETSVHF